ncbi:MAG: hypothetical protein V2I76_09805 [Roseobacter sp.]|jgi:hypothetical protein|nr:hypothetical protein [Roseobacter sp.]
MTHSILTRRDALRGLAGGATTVFLGGCAATFPGDPGAGGTARTARQIGFDLWSGVPGSAFGDTVNKSVGSRRVFGPRSWRHPVTGETLQVYVRENREQNGVRIRYLTMNSDGTALSRVFDRRPGQENDRYFVNDAFVPMGSWADGTRRNYNMTQVQAGQSETFGLSMIMRRADFVFEGRAGSMEYDWIARASSGRTVFHERFVYSPGLGFADFDNRLS